MTKLTLIAARCRELLTIAEKRTQGRWSIESRFTDDKSCALLSAGINEYGDGPAQYVTGTIPRGVLPDNNAAYIAACAGSAEAGWRSTLAAIEFAAECEEDGYKAHSLTDAILAAWPDDLLK